jgi:hypothetical protein
MRKNDIRRGTITIRIKPKKIIISIEDWADSFLEPLFISVGGCLKGYLGFALSYK